MSNKKWLKSKEVTKVLTYTKVEAIIKTDIENY
jgi:hypothetical protein